MIRCASILAIVLWASIASAHKPSDSYLRIEVEDDLLIRWDIALRDLEVVIGLDANTDGKITWDEVQQRRELIGEVVQTHLGIDVDDQRQPIELERIEITEHSDGTYAALRLRIHDPGGFNTLLVHYDLLFEIDPTHRALVSYQGRRGGGAYVISAGDRPLIVQASGNGWLMPLIDYIGEGIWHIWIGIDHILFLIALLLPSVWRVRRKEHHPPQFVPVGRFPTVLREVIGIVTCFTIAHSLTLWLVVGQYVELPSRWVEATIAFSIVITAIRSLYPQFKKHSRLLAFSFGLVHGFGFGSVLIDLGLPTSMLVTTLLGFNIGVELGQLAIVALLLPLAFRYRRRRFYRRYVFRYGCYAIAALGALWTIERAAGLTIFGS